MSAVCLLSERYNNYSRNFLTRRTRILTNVLFLVSTRLLLLIDMYVVGIASGFRQK